MAEAHWQAYDAYVRADPPAASEFRRLFRADTVCTVLDIGSCEGEDSLRYARIFPHAHVFAFEPLPDNQNLIRAHFARHRAERCELVPLALSDAPGTARLHVSSGRPPDLFAGEDWNYGNKSSSLLEPASDQPMHGWIQFTREIEVPTDTLDHFAAQRGLAAVDLVHLDVQGAELLVLQGGAATLRRTTAVWLEVSSRENYRGQALDRDIADFMRAHGFALAYAAYLGDASGEGDHLYVNLRLARTWPYYAGCRLRTLARAARRAAGRVMRALALRPR